MKILHVTNAVEWSGGMEQISLLVSELAKRGHENWIACPPDSKLIPALDGNPVHFRAIAMRQDYDLIAAWRLRKLVREISPDVLHTHHAIAHAVALLALTGLEKPLLVVSRRVSFPPRRNPFSRWKYRSRRIRAYAVVSRAVKETLVQGGVDPERIHVIYSALRSERFRSPAADPNLKPSLNIPPGVPVIGKLANYSRWKGQHVFLEAARQILKKRPEAVFLLIGKDTEALLPEARASGIEKSVRILGFRKDVPELLSLLDVSVNAAIEGEGLSGAMRESLMLGIPVVASDVSGNTEIVREGETGYVFPAGQAEALAEKILHALDHREEVRRLAQKGRSWVLENASAEKMVSDCLALYRSLAGRPS